MAGLSQRMIQVLVVESDNQSFQTIEQSLLNSATQEYQVTRLTSLTTDQLLSLSFDVLLLSQNEDIDEPTSVLELVLQLNLTQPTLYLTNHFNLHIDHLALQLGANDCLPKTELTATFLTHAIQHAIQRKETEAKLAYLSTHDRLTKLANRYLLYQHLEHAISLAKRASSQFGVLHIDIDKFKLVNDSLGHAIGDLLLKLVAERLLTCIRETDIVARLGNDQFAVLIENSSDSRDIAIVAKKIQQIIQPVFKVHSHELFVTASVGIATFPECGKDPETILKSAEMALHKAKQMGRNKFQFFTNELNHQAKLKLELEKNLRRALINGEFAIHLQPQINTQSETVAGAEALLRWNHPKYGFISPVVFIPLLEDLGLLVGVESWVLNQVCHLAQKLTDKYGKLRFSVNISGTHFNTGNLKENIYLALQASSLDANYLEVELTEDIMIEHVERNSSVLTELKELGISIALDDFGKGYSSLSYLKNFPADVLKIDKAFVDHLVSDRRDTAIVEAMVSLSQKLGIKVVAEGVEHKQQFECLKAIGCDYIQGYYFAKPMPTAEFEKFLANRIKKIPVADEHQFSG